MIAHKRAAALEKAIFQVMPEAKSSTAFRLEGSGGFAALAANGVGAEAAAAPAAMTRRSSSPATTPRAGSSASPSRRRGWATRISSSCCTPTRRAKAPSPASRCSSRRETPGLGDRTASDPGFLANFERLSVALTEDLAAVAHPIEAVKHGEKTHDWQIDAITGATVSSVAIAKILRESTAFWVPRLRARIRRLPAGEIADEHRARRPSDRRPTTSSRESGATIRSSFRFSDAVRPWRSRIRCAMPWRWASLLFSSWSPPTRRSRRCAISFPSRCGSRATSWSSPPS